MVPNRLPKSVTGKEDGLAKTHLLALVESNPFLLWLQGRGRHHFKTRLLHGWSGSGVIIWQIYGYARHSEFRNRKVFNSVSVQAVQIQWESTRSAVICGCGRAWTGPAAPTPAATILGETRQTKMSDSVRGFVTKEQLAGRVLDLIDCVHSSKAVRRSSTCLLEQWSWGCYSCTASKDVAWSGWYEHRYGQIAADQNPGILNHSRKPEQRWTE